jgi:hypothetical protein
VYRKTIAQEEKGEWNKDENEFLKGKTRGGSDERYHDEHERRVYKKIRYKKPKCNQKRERYIRPNAKPGKMSSPL